MIIYLFQKPLWLLLSQGACGTSQRSTKCSIASYCAKGTVTISIRMRPRPGSQKGAQSAPFASCFKGTTGEGLMLLSMQQPKILASLDGLKPMPIRTWQQLKPTITSIKIFPQNVSGPKMHRRYLRSKL
jgi:hypothetical protein